MDGPKDRELGLHRKITRRDFLNGIALSAGASLVPWHLFASDASAGPEKAPGYYPPALTGMRGSHPGAFETAHHLRDGDFWQSAGQPTGSADSRPTILRPAAGSGS